MRKIISIYSIIVGFSMIAMWIMLLATAQVIELDTEPYRIITHITSELLTALFLVLGGILFLTGKKSGEKVLGIAFGMLFYSVLNAGGYYYQRGEVIMTAMFFCLLVITTFFIVIHLTGLDKRKQN